MGELKDKTNKQKKKVSKGSKRKKHIITYQGTPLSLPADFSTETLQAGIECQDIFKGQKGKNVHPRILYPARISFTQWQESEQRN